MSRFGRAIVSVDPVIFFQRMDRIQPENSHFFAANRTSCSQAIIKT